MAGIDVDYCSVTYIYVLYDPTKSHDDYFHVRYVGKSNTPSERFNTHMKHANNDPGGRHCWSWINSLCNKGTVPGLKVIECVPVCEWQEAEKEWIEIYRNAGYDLTNMVDGGFGMEGMLDETKEKIRQATVWNHKHNKVFHDKVVRNLIGGNKRGLGFAVSNETRAKLSEIVTAYWDANPERKSEMSARAKRLWKDGVLHAKPVSARTRKKISNTLKLLTGTYTSQSKLTKEQVCVIRSKVKWDIVGSRRKFNHATVKKLAEQYNVSCRTIKDCATYVTYPLSKTN